MSHHLSAVPEGLLTTKETAKRLGMSIRAITSWANSKKIASIKTPGGHLRYTAEEVERAYQKMYGEQQ